MENMEILDMLEKGHIQNLKNKLLQEIMVNSFPEKKRHKAMKEFYKYNRKDAEPFNMAPTLIYYDGTPYTVITDSFCLVLTKESNGDIPLYSDDNNPFPDITHLLSIELIDTAYVDFKGVLEVAKEQGYKPLKKEMVSALEFQYIWKFGQQYFMMGLIDKAISILDNGSDFMVYFDYESFETPIRIENELGIAFICPQVCAPEYHIRAERKIIETSLD